jgi:hypothetical protein
MDWISRWRGASAAKKIIRNGENKIPNLKPLNELMLDIGNASWQCAEELRASLSKLPLKKYTSMPEDQRFLIFVKFLFFFYHFTAHQARSRLPQVKANKLLQTIGEMILSGVVDVFFEHQPDDLKTRILNELYSNLNQADEEYATCRQLTEPPLPTGRVRVRLDDTTVLSRLAFHVLSEAREEKIDPTQIDIETAVLAEMVQVIVMLKLGYGTASKLQSETLPAISCGTLKELGLRVNQAGAALETYERDGNSLQMGLREAREAFLKDPSLRLLYCQPAPSPQRAE